MIQVLAVTVCALLGHRPFPEKVGVEVRDGLEVLVWQILDTADVLGDHCSRCGANTR